MGRKYCMAIDRPFVQDASAAAAAASSLEGGTSGAAVVGTAAGLAGEAGPSPGCCAAARGAVDGSSIVSPSAALSFPVLIMSFVLLGVLYRRGIHRTVSKVDVN